MKSIKEKAEELYPTRKSAILDIANEKFVEGANYVLEQITEAIRVCDNDRKTDLYSALWDCIDNLRK